MAENTNFKNLINHLKIYGFVWPNSEIYGGIRNQYDWGPLGTEIKRNIKMILWDYFIKNESEQKVLGFDGAILSNQKTWINSLHAKLFFDYLSDCKDCKSRFKIDEFNQKLNKDNTPEELNELIASKKLKCLNCNSVNLTLFKKFNMLFNVNLSLTDDKAISTYLRPETAQNIFVNLKNIVQSQRLKFPFGIGQIGKAFRNETTVGNFIFRTKEFEQFELEYFTFPDEWEKGFSYYLDKIKTFLRNSLQVSEKLFNNYFSEHYHSKDELAHYSKKTLDICFKFPFGEKELLGLAYRSDYDLLCHFPKEKITFIDQNKQIKFIPHVVEFSIGIERLLLVILTLGYFEDSINNRVVLKLPVNLAPYKIAVLPLVGKFKAQSYEIYKNLKKDFSVVYDDSGSIGKRYYRQDAIGTPYCVTFDYDSIDTQTVTIRERDSTNQQRYKIQDLMTYFKNKINYS
ncbi:glycine--tRNA ligase [Mycoplasma sp. SG1]|uniref:glycine--tRNA ligase n=1 Tax=Mycoplasma sp. SG1 TaxID=2810348 RepID=UPI0020259254|nr:glycine--tRNA ligase [Mycoplasma sp. SG1]URM53146.1 glycine--tRNA ligase [Mycoplasma sp. SG1]